MAGNLVREIGVWQKQSSAWFQALAAETRLESNVFFNGPRAAVHGGHFPFGRRALSLWTAPHFY